MMLMAVRLLAELPPNPGPNSAGLPGIPAVTTVFGWLIYMALAVIAASGIWSGAMLTVGNVSARPDLALRGKMGLLHTVQGAVMVAIAVPLVDIFYKTVAG